MSGEKQYARAQVCVSVAGAASSEGPPAAADRGKRQPRVKELPPTLRASMRMHLIGVRESRGRPAAMLDYTLFGLSSMNELGHSSGVKPCFL